MARVHVPEHQWRKQKRKQRFKNKKRDGKKSGIKHINQLDEFRVSEDKDELESYMSSRGLRYDTRRGKE